MFTFLYIAGYYKHDFLSSHRKENIFFIPCVIVRTCLHPSLCRISLDRRIFFLRSAQIFMVIFTLSHELHVRKTGKSFAVTIFFRKEQDYYRWTGFAYASDISRDTLHRRVYHSFETGYEVLEKSRIFRAFQRCFWKRKDFCQRRARFL